MARKKNELGRCPPFQVGSAAEPAWRQLQRSIREQIVGGHWQAGDALLPVRQICTRLGLNKVTVDQAIRDLIREGLLYTRPGSGTFVANLAPPTVVILSYAREESAHVNWQEYRTCQATVEAVFQRHNIRTLALLRERVKTPALHGPPLDRVLATPADAYLTIGIQVDSYFQALVQTGKPVVAIDATPLTVSFDAVVFDTFRAGFLAGRYLLQHDCRRILFIGYERLAPATAAAAGDRRIPEPDSERNFAGLHYALRSSSPVPVELQPYDCLPASGPLQAALHADLRSGRFSGAVMTKASAEQLRRAGLLPPDLPLVILDAHPADAHLADTPRIQWDFTAVAEQAARRMLQRLARAVPAANDPTTAASLQLLVEPTFLPGR